MDPVIQLKLTAMIKTTASSMSCWIMGKEKKVRQNRRWVANKPQPRRMIFTSIGLQVVAFLTISNPLPNPNSPITSNPVKIGNPTKRQRVSLKSSHFFFSLHFHSLDSPNQLHHLPTSSFSLPSFPNLLI